MKHNKNKVTASDEGTAVTTKGNQRARYYPHACAKEVEAPRAQETFPRLGLESEESASSGCTLRILVL